MTYGIPAYRLPREPLFAEIDHIRRAGVEIRCGVELGTDFTVKTLQAGGYAAIVLALVAIAVYVAFIASGLMKAQP